MRLAASRWPGQYSSVSSERRAWQRAQVSTSTRGSWNLVGFAVPRTTSICQLRLRRSPKRTTSPGSPVGCRPRERALRAQATWREPGPWHASQETEAAENVVANWSCGQR